MNFLKSLFRIISWIKPYRNRGIHNNERPNIMKLEISQFVSLLNLPPRHPFQIMPKLFLFSALGYQKLIECH